MSELNAGETPALPGSNRPVPSLTPSFPLSSKETGRVVTNVVSPEPHLGWYSRGYLPHWDHPGMIQSLNFRLSDALPLEVLNRWNDELGLGNLTGSAGVSPALTIAIRREASVPSEKQRQIELRQRVEEYLDAGRGACWLQHPEVAELVEGAMRHFDGERYRLLAWCVMPNHVHALIETRAGFPLADVLHSWKSFTSRKAGKLVGRSGEFWQREYLDRYVRHAEHYQAVIAYIEANPVKAGLVRVNDEWPWSSARFRAGSAGVSPASGLQMGATPQSERTAGETPALPGQTAGETPALPEQTAGETPALPEQTAGERPVLSEQTAGERPVLSGQTAGETPALPG